MRGCGCSAMSQAPAASAAAITSIRTKRIMRKLRTASSSTTDKRKLNGDRCAEFLPARRLTAERAQVASKPPSLLVSGRRTKQSLDVGRGIKLWEQRVSACPTVGIGGALAHKLSGRRRSKRRHTCVEVLKHM